MAGRNLLADEPLTTAPPAPAEAGGTNLLPQKQWGILDYLEDWGRSALGGPRRGLESIPGTAGDVYQGLSTLASWAQGATPEEQERIYQDLDKQRWGVSGPEAETLTEPYLGEHYEPQSRVGRILNLLGASITGGGGRHILRDFVAPAVGGEIGGEVGAAIGGPTGQLVGTVAGGGTASSLQEAGKRKLMPQVTPEETRRINTLRNEGVELTGGQALGSDALKFYEAGPFSGKAAGIADQQRRQFTRAAMRRAGLDSDTADPNTLSRAQDAFGAEYDALIQANNGVVMDPHMQQALVDSGSRYERLKGGSNDAVGYHFNRILDASTQHGGVIPPEVFQQINAEIGADLRAARNSPELAAMSDTLRDMRDSLYASMERNGQPGIAEKARDLNNRYRNFKIIEKSMRGAGDDTSLGFVSPGKLRAAVEQSESITDWTQSRGDFDDLARAGAAITPLPNSGTAGRGMAGATGAGIVSGTGLLLAGQPLAGAGMIGTSLAAPIAPAVMSSVLTSKPVRTSIVNRAAGEAPNAWDQLPIPSHWWDPLPIQAATPAMWQTGTQEDEPVPIDEVPLSAPAAAPEPVPDQRSSLEPDVLRDVASLPLSDMMALSTRRGIPLNTRRYIG